MKQPLSRIIADRVFGYPSGQTVGIEFYLGSIARIVMLAPTEVPGYTDEAGGSRTLDLRGLTVLPGLVDAHVHAIASGMLMLGGFLDGVTTLDGIVAAYHHEEALAGECVRLAGLDLSKFNAQESMLLDRVWLDKLATGRPLIIKSVEGHSSWFNTQAWNLLNVGAVINACHAASVDQQRMWESGRVFGEAYENLANEIYDTFSMAERREGMRRLLARAAEVGLTGIHCMEGYGTHRREDFELIRELDGQTCRLTLYARDSNPGIAKELGVNRFGGCWCVDGAIGSYTAALSESYIDRPDSCGMLYFTDDELSAWIEAGLREQMQVCVHAIGDKALEQVIGIYEKLAAVYDLKSFRPRVEHFILGSPQQGERAARLGICSAMQPAFDARWGGPTGGYAARLGAQRAMQTNPVGGMIAAGLKVAGSSDSYITPLDPLGGVRAAVNHHNPSQRVVPEVAVKLFSEYPAYLEHRELTKGRIAPGYQADLTVVSTEPISESAEVIFTIVDGSIVYEQTAHAQPASGKQ